MNDKQYIINKLSSGNDKIKEALKAMYDNSPQVLYDQVWDISEKLETIYQEVEDEIHQEAIQEAIQEESYNIDDLVNKCVEYLEEYIIDNIDENQDYFGDYIHEIADQETPHYYHDIFRYASDNSVIQHWESELTEGGEEPYKVIQIAIYEYITQQLWEKLDDLIQAVEESLLDEEDK